MLKDLDNLTVNALKKICLEQEITGISKLNKKQLINHIKTFMLNKTIQEGLEQLLAIKE